MNELQIDLRVIFKNILDRKLLVAKVTILACVIALVLSFIIPKTYISIAVLKPTEQNSVSNLSQFSGLASLAGVTLPMGNIENNAALAIELIQSQHFISSFLDNRNITSILFGATSWNPRKDILSYNNNIYSISENKWTRKTNFPRTSKPSRSEAHEKFMEIISIVQDKKTGYITISLESVSPYLAREWLAWLIQDVNTFIADLNIKESSESIKYLKEQVNNTQYSELRIMFYELIQEYTKSLMLAKVNKEYALSTIDPPSFEEEHISPKKLIYLFVGFAFGILLSMALLFLKSVFPKNRILKIFK